MVQPAISGGSNTILDARQMIEDALLYEPEIVSILLQPHFVFSRDDQCARSPILIRISPDTWSIRWRYDFTILVASEACDALNLFHSIVNMFAILST
ncbi:hypothetical protein [Limnofasciculus baicalensis]|uniref:Uncharacterized protein n=1 Tax=Limnofasciculus baicalensis BBK-W-15 TaxID=2699891 RepID=A0AAE3KMK2_9CYAN|nr:hypothetical protein [Limnofasciculus baicalensis]MCP2729555.1 hypothetical protein [Limnofasciculus baicalensis BBK-W-15]